MAKRRTSRRLATRTSRPLAKNGGKRVSKRGGSDMRRVEDAARAAGWAVERTKAGHLVFRSPDRSVPPVYTGSDIGERLAIKNIESMLRRHGLETRSSRVKKNAKCPACGSPHYYEGMWNRDCGEPGCKYYQGGTVAGAAAPVAAKAPSAAPGDFRVGDTVKYTNVFGPKQLRRTVTVGAVSPWYTLEDGQHGYVESVYMDGGRMTGVLVTFEDDDDHDVHYMFPVGEAEQELRLLYRQKKRSLTPNPEQQRIVYASKPLKKFKPVSIFEQPAGYTTAKPNGLWYSCGNEWEAWMRRHQTLEQVNLLARTKFKYEVKLATDEMLLIRTPEEFDAFEHKYGKNGAINWWDVIRDYAGIEICPYRSDRTVSMEASHDRAMMVGRKVIAAHWYDLWDVASGAVWRPGAVKKIISLGEFQKNRSRA